MTTFTSHLACGRCGQRHDAESGWLAGDDEIVFFITSSGLKDRSEHDL